MNVIVRKGFPSSGFILIRAKSIRMNEVKYISANAPRMKLLFFPWHFLFVSNRIRLKSVSTCQKMYLNVICSVFEIGRKEIFYLTTHSTHFSYGYMGKGKGNVIFNDALNTFYLRLYGFGHMVEDHSDSERGNPLPPHGLLFPINRKVFFYMHHPTDWISHTSRGALVGTSNSSMGPPHEGSIRRPIASRANALTTELHLAPLKSFVFVVVMWVGGRY